MRSGSADRRYPAPAGNRPPKVLHRAFWITYTVTSVVAILASEPLRRRWGVDETTWGLLAACSFALYQEALFVGFVIAERIYRGYTRRPTFYAALAVANAVVLGGFVLVVRNGLLPAGATDLAFAGGGIIGGNIGAVAVLLLSFGATRTG